MPILVDVCQYIEFLFSIALSSMNLKTIFTIHRLLLTFVHTLVVVDDGTPCGHDAQNLDSAGYSEA